MSIFMIKTYFRKELLNYFMSWISVSFQLDGSPSNRIKKNLDVTWMHNFNIRTYFICLMRFSANSHKHFKIHADPNAIYLCWDHYIWNILYIINFFRIKLLNVKNVLLKFQRLYIVFLRDNWFPLCIIHGPTLIRY